METFRHLFRISGRNNIPGYGVCGLAAELLKTELAEEGYLSKELDRAFRDRESNFTIAGFIYYTVLEWPADRATNGPPRKMLYRRYCWPKIKRKRPPAIAARSLSAIFALSGERCVTVNGRVCTALLLVNTKNSERRSG